MTNTETNKRFLAAIDQVTRKEILGSIALHYRSTEQKIFEEVTEEGAEHLLDYMKEPQRSATSALMQKYHCR